MSRLERWSRLKRGEVAASPEAPLPPQGRDEPGREPPEPDHPDRDSAPSAPPAPGSLDHTLPDPDTLPAGSDIKAFMASGVSSGLRKRALRRLFAADHYGIRDGLDDYDDDYRVKLQPLASEVAERLRSWTRRQLEDHDEVSEEHAQEAREGSHADAQQAATGPTVTADDPAVASREQAEDDNREEPADDAGRPPGAP